MWCYHHSHCLCDYRLTPLAKDLTRSFCILCGLHITLSLFLSLSAYVSLPQTISPSPGCLSSLSCWCQPPVCMGPPRATLGLLTPCHVRRASIAVVKEIERLISSVSASAYVTCGGVFTWINIYFAGCSDSESSREELPSRASSSKNSLWHTINSPRESTSPHGSLWDLLGWDNYWKYLVILSYKFDALTHT